MSTKEAAPFEANVAVLDLLRTSVGELGLQQIMILLTVMGEEGITQHDLTERYQFQQGSVSRNCKKLSTFETTDPITGEEVTQGMGLLRMSSSPDEYRKVECRLTQKGGAIRRQLQRIVSPELALTRKRYYADSLSSGNAGRESVGCRVGC